MTMAIILNIFLIGDRSFREKNRPQWEKMDQKDPVPMEQLHQKDPVPMDGKEQR
jgi:hypothetical protein